MEDEALNDEERLACKINILIESIYNEDLTAGEGYLQSLDLLAEYADRLVHHAQYMRNLEIRLRAVEEGYLQGKPLVV